MTSGLLSSFNKYIIEDILQTMPYLSRTFRCIDCSWRVEQTDCDSAPSGMLDFETLDVEDPRSTLKHGGGIWRELGDRKSGV